MDKPDSENNNTKAISSGRMSRLAQLGKLAGGVAGGMLAEGARQVAQGKRPQVRDLLLTPANARRVTDQLAQLRGAAMKVGQLMSMDAGDLFPPELSEILSGLRSQAKSMPLSQLAQVLDANWGKGWNTRFQQFSFQPIAAASIGQVHSAHTKDGRHLALKIQYPGVRESINSDVDNVATLLRISGLIPKGIDYQPLLEEAKRQLHQETDYTQEGIWLQRYSTLLEGSPDFTLPALHADFCTQDILAMSYIGGVPVESLSSAPQEERDRVATLLIALMFREIFEFRLIQTDPNFANYQYDSQSRQLVLLDFGATREYPEAIVEGYRDLMAGAMHNDPSRMDAGATAIGFFEAEISPEQRSAVIGIFAKACEPLRQTGSYDFGSTDLAARLRDEGMVLSMEQGYWHTPPADALFLHRKLGGMYLLAARLRARVDVRGLFLPYSKGV